MAQWLWAEVAIRLLLPLVFSRLSLFPVEKEHPMLAILLLIVIRILHLVGSNPPLHRAGRASPTYQS